MDNKKIMKEIIDHCLECPDFSSIITFQRLDCLCQIIKCNCGKKWNVDLRDLKNGFDLHIFNNLNKYVTDAKIQRENIKKEEFRKKNKIYNPEAKQKNEKRETNSIYKSAMEYLSL